MPLEGPSSVNATPHRERALDVASPATIAHMAAHATLRDIDRATAEAIVDVCGTDFRDWLLGLGATLIVFLALAATAAVATGHSAGAIKPLAAGVAILAPVTTVLLQRHRVLRELAALGLSRAAAKEALRRLGRVRARQVEDGGQRFREIEALLANR